MHSELNIDHGFCYLLIFFFILHVLALLILQAIKNLSQEEERKEMGITVLNPKF